MSILEQLIQQMIKMNRNIETLIGKATTTKKWMNVPEAAAYFGVSQAKMRSLCHNGVLPCSNMNKNPKMKHYRINMDEAIKIMDKGVHAQMPVKEPTRGRKSKLNLNT